MAKPEISPVEVSKVAKFQQGDLEIALEFAEAHDHFDDTFLRSLEKFMDRRGYLTNAQYNSLLNVMDKWDMFEWAERKDV